MDKKQFKNFSKFIDYESGQRFYRLIEEEVLAQPHNEKFLKGIAASSFFKSLFMRGFIEGISFEKAHRDTKYVY